jgi:hypothetical protein
MWDGCCSGSDVATELFAVGEVIEVTEKRISDRLFFESVDADGFEHWEYFRPAYNDLSQYVKDGYLKLVTP